MQIGCGRKVGPNCVGVEEVTDGAGADFSAVPCKSN